MKKDLYGLFILVPLLCMIMVWDRFLGNQRIGSQAAAKH